MFGRFDLSRRSAAGWIGIALVVLALLLLPFVVDATLGRAWVRIIDVALLFIMLALGLNIVVGFAGLLDLGYIAFFAVGASSYALLASPQFDIHWSFLALLPLGAFVAAIFGILLGAVGVAVALAFGLGARDVAGKQVERWAEELRPSRSSSPAKR